MKRPGIIVIKKKNKKKKLHTEGQANNKDMNSSVQIKMTCIDELHLIWEVSPMLPLKQFLLACLWPVVL